MARRFRRSRRRRPSRRARRVTRRTRRRSRTGIRKQRLGYLLPDVITCSLPYNTGGVTLATGGTTEYVMSGNSVFDPDATGGSSGSCMLFEELRAIWGTYIVKSSSIAVTLFNNMSPANQAGMGKLIIVPTTGAGNLTGVYSIEDILEMKNAKEYNWGLYQRPPTIRHRASTTKVLGPIGADPFQISGSPTSNPSLNWYWHVITVNSDESTTTSGQTRWIKMVYNVEFSERLPVLGI